MLQLSVCGDFTPEVAEFLGAAVHAAEDLKDNDAEYDKQRCYGEEGPDQLRMDRKRRSRHKPGQPFLHIETPHAIGSGMLSRDLASPGSRRGWKALTRDQHQRVASKQSREVALFGGASGSCRRGLHSQILTTLFRILFSAH